MSAKNYPALGTQLQMGDGATPTENFTPIAHLGDIQAPAIKLDTVEVTSHSDTWKQRVATLLDGGDVTLSLNFDPAEATHKNAAGGITYAQLNKTLKNWKIQLPDQANSIIAFAAYVTDFQIDAPVAGKLAAKLKLQVSGAVTMP